MEVTAVKTTNDDSNPLSRINKSEYLKSAGTGE